MDPQKTPHGASDSPALRADPLSLPQLGCRVASEARLACRYGDRVARRRITDEDVLGAIVELCGDGYCLVADVLPLFPGRFSHADRRRAVHRSVNRGLVIQRRGPDGREHVAVASEGWRLLRSQAA